MEQKNRLSGLLDRLEETRRGLDMAAASGDAEAIRRAEEAFVEAQQAYDRGSIESYFGGRFQDDAEPIPALGSRGIPKD